MSTSAVAWQVRTDRVVVDGGVVDARVGTWSSTGTGVVLLLPGRGDSLELRAPIAAHLASLGLTTVMPEHVGQGGSGHLGHHPEAVHVRDLGVHLIAAERALDRAVGLAGGRPVHLLAHSMGGLVAAHLLARHHQRLAGAVLTAPMWGYAGGLPLRFVRLLARGAERLGAGRRFALGERPFSVERCLDMRTSDPAAREELLTFAAQHPHLLRGGSTWSWVRAMADGMLALDSLPLEEVTTPVTVLLARDEQTVSHDAARRTAARLPRVEVRVVDGAHDLLSGSAAVRAQVWASLVPPDPSAVRE